MRMFFLKFYILFYLPHFIIKEHFLKLFKFNT